MSSSTNSFKKLGKLWSFAVKLVQQSLLWPHLLDPGSSLPPSQHCTTYLKFHFSSIGDTFTQWTRTVSIEVAFVRYHNISNAASLVFELFSKGVYVSVHLPLLWSCTLVRCSRLQTAFYSKLELSISCYALPSFHVQYLISQRKQKWKEEKWKNCTLT